MANDTDWPQSQADSREARKGGFRTFVRGVRRGTQASSPPRFGRIALGMAAAGALSFGVLGTVAYGVWFNEDQQAYAAAISAARKTFGVREPSLMSGGAASVLTQQGVADQDEPREPAKVVVSATRESARTATGDADSASIAQVQAREPAMWSGQVARSQADRSIPTTQAVPTDLAATMDTTDPSTTTAATDPAAIDPGTSAGTSTAATLAANPAPTPAVTPAQNTAPPRAPSSRASRHGKNGAAAQSAGSGRNAKETRLAQQDRNGSAANQNHKSGGLFARVSQFFRHVGYRQHDSGHQQQDLYSHP